MQKSQGDYIRMISSALASELEAAGILAVLESILENRQKPARGLTHFPPDRPGKR
jgi:hypothetical protein